MKLILKSEVDNLGLPGDVVDVSDGYGRNYLIPRGLAIKATKGGMKEAEAITRSRKARESKTLHIAEAHRNTLEARTLRIPVRVDDLGHLYGSVSAQDVHRVLKERGHDIERRRVDLRSPIKKIGTYEVGVHVHPQVTATVTVEVVDVEGKVLVADAKPEADKSLEERALEAAAEADAEEAAEAGEAAGADATDGTGEDGAEASDAVEET